MTDLTIRNSVPNLTVAVVETRLEIQPSSPELQARLAAVAARVAAKGLPGGTERSAAVRNLLRQGGFRPAGRNKPAQEYLLRTAQADRPPSINNAVDLINMISLESGLPISLIALARTGTELEFRHGTEGERYVFNTARQELDLHGLICLCSVSGQQSRPVASPVKDSLLAKVAQRDNHLLACLYASEEAMSRAELDEWAVQLAEGFRRWCGAVEATILPLQNNS
jgi:DNA/RNA-binding domain of Phe-tRNA-synthetase-like protein